MGHLLTAVISLADLRTHSSADVIHAHAHAHSHVQVRLTPAAKAHLNRGLRILGLHLHPHIRPKGPVLDYIALFLFAMLSGIGVNGFGEVALLGAGIYAANHNVPIEPVLLIAWLGATLGGIVGWLIGWQAGRRLLTAAGPLHRLRTGMLAHSEAVFFRHRTLAVLLTPSWAAGIEKVQWRQYAPLNALSALLWALPLGLGAFFLGRRITTEFSDEIGWVVGALVVLYVVYALLQRLLRSPREPAR